MIIWHESGINWATIGLGWLFLVACLGVLIGILYNHFVNWLHAEKHDQGYTALLVVGGVVITLGLALPFIGLEHTAIVTVLFICTGTPMIVGDVWRYVVERRQRAQKLAKTLKELGGLDEVEGDGNP